MTQPSKFQVSRLHIILFLATAVTTLLAGYSFTSIHLLSEFSLNEFAKVNPANTLKALSFSLPVMLILFSHEMGHYITARRLDVEVTPPYFLPGIPIPFVGMLPYIGTFGAFIKMNVTRIPSWNLMRIAAWGPIAGYLLAVPILLWGMAISKVEPLQPGSQTLGPTLLLWLGESLFHPNIPEGHDLTLSPLAMAGWFGSFLTALNLLPIGQLDGGHIAYASLGKIWNKIGPLLFLILIVLGIFSFCGWLVFALLLLKLGLKHPDTTSDLRVTGSQYWMTAASLIMLATTFTPAPFTGLSLIDMIKGLI